MILLFDESISPQVPQALRQDGYDALSFHNLGWLGEDDVIWLPKAGQIADSLVLSRDRAMLDDSDELQEIIDNNVGIVFLTSGQQPVESVIQLVTASLELLEELHNNTPRPFTRFLTTEGHLRRRLHGRGL